MATPYRWCAWMRCGSCATSNRSSATRSRPRRSKASSPIRASAPSRSCAAVWVEPDRRGRCPEPARHVTAARPDPAAVPGRAAATVPWVPLVSRACPSTPVLLATGPAHDPAARGRPDRSGARLHANQARGEPAGHPARARRHRRDRDPRQQEPAPARPRPGRLQGRPVRGPRRHRGRRARPRHRGAPARRQLRAADGPRGLRPPHRPDRSGRR